MFQVIDGRKVFVVDFDVMPELPITWSNSSEEPYAKALGAAIATGVVVEPGMYGIEVDTDVPGVDLTYNVYTIQ